MTETNEKNKIRKAKFEDLRIWQEANKLRLEIHAIANKLPNAEFRLIDQIKRSSSSVPDNIAEASGAFYYKDKLKCFYTSRKEDVETQNHIFHTFDKKYLRQEQKDALIHRYQGLIIGINRYIQKINQTMNNYKNNQKLSR